MIRKNRLYLRATVLAFTLAGCQNHVAPTAPEVTRPSPAQQEAAVGSALAVGSQSPVTRPATIPDSPDVLPDPTATESPAVDLPDLEPEFVESDLGPSRALSNVPPSQLTLPPNWYQPGRPVPPNWAGAGMPVGSWDDAPVPGTSLGLEEPPVWSGNPDTLTYGADPRLFQQLPSEIPANVAGNVLYPINFDQISAGFGADEFRGLPGTYMGFAPGLSYNLLRRCRYLYAGGVFIPFIYTGYRYIPVVFVSPRHRMYVYPSLIYLGGTLVPIYQAAPHLFGPFSQAFPINFGATFTSPLDLLQIPGPVMNRPIRLRRHSYRHNDHDLFDKVRFLKTFRPKIGIGKHKISVVRTKVKVRQRIRHR